MGICISREVQVHESFEGINFKHIKSKQVEYSTKKNYCIEGDGRIDMLISISANQRNFNEVTYIQKMKTIRKQLRNSS